MPAAVFPMVMASDAVPVPAILVAPSVTLNVPTAAGEPVIKPVAASMPRPAGRPVALKLAGTLAAVIV